ncbi:MAG: hypothetical protein AAF432_00725 [Planctomycetota bacterium]
MSDGLNETQLMDFIDGTMSPEDVARVEAQLQRDPKAAAVIRRLCADREALVSTPDPEMPRDFVGDLETMLSRPMLIEHEPGEYRRKQHRERTQVRTRRVVRRFAMAASVLLLVGMGWMAAVVVSRLDLLPDNTLLVRGPQPGEDRAPAPFRARPLDEQITNLVTGEVFDEPTPEALVHHRWPEALPMIYEPPRGVGGEIFLDIEPIVLTHAITVAMSETDLASVLSAHVRNTEADDSVYRTVTLDPNGMATAAPATGAPTTPGREDNGYVAGSTSVRPSPIDQERLAQAGVDITITLPARDVVAWLNALGARADVGWTNLQNADDAASLLGFGNARAARAELEAILQADPHADVVVPIKAN